jgi:hypothetical protein
MPQAVDEPNATVRDSVMLAITDLPQLCTIKLNGRLEDQRSVSTCQPPARMPLTGVLLEDDRD